MRLIPTRGSLTPAPSGDRQVPFLLEGFSPELWVTQHGRGTSQPAEAVRQVRGKTDLNTGKKVLAPH